MKKKQDKEKKKKVKVVYKEDTGETIYSMASLYGLTPEQAEKFAEDKKNKVKMSRKEKRAARHAVYTVYGPMFLCIIFGFALALVILYLIMR